MIIDYFIKKRSVETTERVYQVTVSQSFDLPFDKLRVRSGLRSKNAWQFGIRSWRVPSKLSFRKEVMQPQVRLRLPCYDLVPVIGLTVSPRHILYAITSDSALLPGELPACNPNWGDFFAICSTWRSSRRSVGAIVARVRPWA